MDFEVREGMSPVFFVKVSVPETISRLINPASDMNVTSPMRAKKKRSKLLEIKEAWNPTSILVGHR